MLGIHDPQPPITYMADNIGLVFFFSTTITKLIWLLIKTWFLAVLNLEEEAVGAFREPV